MAGLSDGAWAVLKQALERVRSGEERHFQQERRTVEAVIWRMRTGAPWRALPGEFGPWWRAAQLHIRWSRKGRWRRVLEILRDEGCPDLGEVFLTGAASAPTRR